MIGLAIRLDARPVTTASPKPRTCIECGASFHASSRADFCGDPCKRTFNNRRAMRGAELYDLVMAWRFDRKAATALHLWRLICRMASGFRDQDTQERGGRKSWRSPREIVARHAYLHATTVARNINHRRRP